MAGPGAVFLSGWAILLAAPFIGSWLGVLVCRLPQGRPVVLGRSACAHCGRELAPRDLVPLLSFLCLRGRCRHCGAALGWFYPGIELAALAVAAAAVWAAGGGWAGWADAALGWALLTLGWIDARTLRLPDALTLPLILAGLLVTSLAAPWALYDHAAAAAAGYISFRIINALYRALRGRDGLGAGDAKLLAAAGAWLGLAALPYVVFGAALAGLAFALAGGLRGTRRIAFGPALAAAFFVLHLLPPLAGGR